ncbi:hypothetical protein LTR10_022185 [Elasticomyces elasticus]|uniref:Metallo-beta-lactamase domain-containing protein n=1 Tax=Exophiala sideris TaxID=1016849 RepID=A0ABR0J4N6_9EURO|nr:hypothetical protein LTR10_022185 [Elasticomyces elasticus]KAK5026831.1 hypothetical protein LTS07_007129 [Exophiala sideris]KAK5033835.1 hypothetical protein LTR13_006434 [Exophiala sideris]KAK5055891.1 hypothetical protein LTR69_008267 [Exophiala sideris]KAK5180777.1 hypothetical protein LTR44_006596 [Eurotiomycetes sp. CCFEE 6388]
MSSIRRTSSRPAHHANNAGTSFINPWPSASKPSWAELTRASFPFGRYEVGLHSHRKARDVKVINPDWGATSLEKCKADKSKCIIGTWLGHAGALVEVPSLDKTEQKSLWLLIDPIFSLRAGPTQYSGVARMKQSPCQVDHLPGCDAVFISHNHYDHLDLSTIKAVWQRFPQARYFVPLGIKQWMLSCGIPDKLVYELDWWQNREYSLADFHHQAVEVSDSQTLFRFTCVPAQHNSGRGPMDQGVTLWCGWVIERLLRSKDESTESIFTRKGSIYHAGDTGYRRMTGSDAVCPAFKEIGNRFGPFDLSFVPIWRGGSLGFISSIGLRLSHHDIPSAFHGSPADAIAIHQDVKSRNTIGIHFGTFIGSVNESYEAVIEFGQTCDEHSVGDLQDEAEGENGRAGTLDIGASLAVEIS